MTLLKHVASVLVSNVDKKSRVGEQSVRLCNYTDVYYGNILTSSGNEYMKATASIQQCEQFRLLPGDTLLTKDSETADDIGVSAYIAESALDFICGYHLAVIRPIKSAIDPKFLSWVLRSLPVRDQMTTSATGVTRFGLRTEALTRISFDLPSLAEQRRIADFLDDQVTVLDLVIELRRRQIDLLRERLKTQLSAALLPLHRSPAAPGLPRRDLGRGSRDTSGSARDRTLTQVRLKTVARSVVRKQVAGERFLIGLENVESGTGRLLSADVSVAEAGENLAFEPSDVLFGKLRPYLAKSLLVKVPLFGSGEFLALRSTPMLEPRYLFHVTMSQPWLDWAIATSYGSKMPRTSWEHLGGYLMHLPLLEEQRRIADFLDNQVASFEVAIALRQRQIELLAECKQSLITSAVTGRFSVTTAKRAA